LRLQLWLYWGRTHFTCDLSLLHFGAITGKIEIIKYCCEEGGYDINIKDELKRTPLFDAVRKNEATIVEYLLDRGADCNVQDDLQKTPLHIVASERIATMLVRAGADINAKCTRPGLLETFSSSSKLPVGQRYADVRYDCNGFSYWETSGTPLHFATEYGDIKVLETLLSNEAIDVHAVDDLGQIALHRARSKESIQLLLKYGANKH
jgi:ankyrin repeat protein